MRDRLFSATINKQDIEERIKSSKNLINSIDTPQKKYFLIQLTNRICDFESELLSDKLNSSDKEHVLIQYDRFAKTLSNCLQHPERTSLSIQYYHKLKYYPVGIHDTIKPNPLLQNIAMQTVAAGIVLLAGSIPTFVFNPVLGAILLSISITLLFPSCFYLMTPESPDTTKKKSEEKSLFELGAQLIKPDLKFDDNFNIESADATTFAYSY